VPSNIWNILPLTIASIMIGIERRAIMLGEVLAFVARHHRIIGQTHS
jgi:hypothetical protein